MSRINIIVAGTILVSFALGIAFYPSMPDLMASHWDVNGNVNGYLPKAAALSIMPIISLILFAFFLLLPTIDPLKENINEFRKYFDNFILLFIIFLFYINFLTIIWNLGVLYNISVLITPAICILFYYVGVLLENAKQNWFVGIRTPWTLSNERVWEKTNKIGGRLFKISAIVSALGLFFTKISFFLIIFSAFFIAIFSVLYSYLEYRKEKRS